MRKITILVFLLFLNCNSFDSRAQCKNQVTHLSGSAMVNGVNVTVTSSGFADNLIYCSSTSPYLIGFKKPSSHGTGSYTFTFSPPVNFVTLNFSGISNSSSVDEVVKLFVNGSHYSIPSPGIANGCDDLAVLLPSGDIAGCPSCAVSGWSGTTITGPVSFLTVLDTLYMGTLSGGSLFSLFLCEKNAIAEQFGNQGVKIYPNPCSDLITVSSSDFVERTFSLFDVLGRLCLKKNFSTTSTVETSQLAEGLYFYEIRYTDGTAETGKIVKK